MKNSLPIIKMACFLTLMHMGCIAEDLPEQVIGRPVTIATIPIGCGGDYAVKLPLALDLLERAGACGVDIACLPEEFSGGVAESIPGPTTEAVAALAKKHNMYVICPICEAEGDRTYNTAVLLDRKGSILGRYRKVFVFWSENRHASTDGVPVFDLDFGRIALLNCFDLNFPELWNEAEQKGAEIVFWPSAFGGGRPLNSYACIHAYYVVGVGDGNFIDMTGETISPAAAPHEKVFIATIDLDRTLVHKDYMREKVKRLLAEQEGKAAMEKDWHPEGWFMLRATAPGISIRELCSQYGIETLRDYRSRSRAQINERRRKGLPVAADENGVPK
jgi:predicted amidohydrolase